MPKRTDIKTILLIGSGPIIIGQACEFDYSGTQAAKTLKELGYRVVLVNSNPATIMTDPEFADRTYIEPITEEAIADIIKREKVDAILPTMGGQTALNVAMSMWERGMLKGVEFLGAKPQAIKKGEDRQAFKEAMQKIGMDLPRSFYAYNLAQANEAAEKIGFPVIIRASYTLAGGGSGVAYNQDEFADLAAAGLAASPINEILIEESLLGWKEFEMEVIRDKNDNCIIVCSIENFDPMGVHTGDSITIAPALTLTDKEYQRMRDASFAILREIGVDTGGSNVQFAINPQTGRMTVIEMNPRVSRSSALASKATGYPIAKVATLLAVGYTLDEIKNDMTNTPASFEPSIDYIVSKVPRFAFEKFSDADSTLSTSMKSIGEVMAIGASFCESIQKALCSLESDLRGFDSISSDLAEIEREVRRPNAKRILYLADALRCGVSAEMAHSWCKIDPFFISQIQKIVDFEKNINIDILKDEKLLRKAKLLGFCDAKIAELISKNSSKNGDKNGDKNGALGENEITEAQVYSARKALGIVREYCEVDTCAAEFATQTAYLYSTIPLNSVNSADSINLDSIESSAKNIESKSIKIPKNVKIPKKVLILGGGPNRIGQGIEFDYCCVHASFALRELGAVSVMYNCNPETVSTDYDTSDVLYFEPISLEFVKEVLETQKPDGLIVHFGGQTPLKLANKLAALNAPIIGTSAEIIDIAEDRKKWAAFVEKNNLKQPPGSTAFTREEALKIAEQIGYPVLVRPSYVLGGRAMKIVQNADSLREYMENATRELGLVVSEDSPILIDKFLQNAIELDVDVICDGSDVFVAGIMQHIEEAGIHSGDSACSLPPVSISAEKITQIEKTAAKIALNLGVRGLMNAQFAIFENELYLIEVNPRASRTVPFVSKAIGVPLAKVATYVMCGISLADSIKHFDKFNKIQSRKDSIESEAAMPYSVIQSEAAQPRSEESSAKADSIKSTREFTLFSTKKLKHIALKESVFPFSKLGSIAPLGPEMRSTGEVMGISESFGLSFAKSQAAAKNAIATSGKVFLSLKNADKEEGAILAKELAAIGFSLVATSGTANALRQKGIECEEVLKISQGRPNIADLLANKEIAMAINTSDAHSNAGDTQAIRMQVLRNSVPYFTTLEAARALNLAENALKNGSVNSTKALQDYLSD